MFMPFLDVKVNVINMSAKLSATNAEQLATRDSAQLVAGLKRYKKHGFNFAVVSTSFTETQLQTVLGDCIYRGEWNVSSYPLAANTASVTLAPKLVAACTEAGISYSDGNSLRDVKFYDADTNSEVGIEQVLMDLSVNETIESFCSKQTFSATAENQKHVAADACRDIVSLIARGNLPGLTADRITCTATVAKTFITVQISYSGVRRSWKYEVRAADGYVYCAALKRYDGYIKTFIHKLPLLG